MRICYTAIFGSEYDELKEPAIVSEGWKYICYTDQPLKSDVWEIVHVKWPKDLNPQKFARWYKIMGWIDWEESMWVDASFEIKCDLNEWWADKYKAPFSCAKHPLRTSIYAECRSCVVNNRGDNGKVLLQEQRYKQMSFPDHQGIITSGILLRGNTPENIKLHEAWWKELNSNSVRDQLAFAFVSLGIDWIHTYQWDYTQNKHQFVYSKHKHLR